MKNKFCTFIIVTLLLSVTTTANPPIVRASPPLALTVDTNKQFYYLRENVNIYGNLTLDGSPIQDELVALEVHDPMKAIVFRTIKAGTPPPGKIAIVDLYSCADQWGTPKTRFTVGTTAWFNATVKNNDTVTRDVTISVSAYDGNNIPLGVGRGTMPVPPGTTAWAASSVLIPAWARIGNATVYASAWIPNGAPYCPEKSTSFEITRDSSAPPGGLNPPIIQDLGVTAAYNSTFKLSPEPLPGTYTVYVASSHAGEQSTNSTTFQVEDTQYPPQASFTYSPPTPYMNQQVTFDASGSTAEGYGDYIVWYEWDFGDNSSKVKESDPIKTYAYATNRTYTVTLNVTDNEGLWCTASKPITILPPSPPKANFTYSPPTPAATGITTFNATLSEPGYNGTAYVPIVSYKWDFGDNTSATVGSAITTHVYATNGTFTVILNVTDAQGRWNTTSQILTVALPYGPKANFTYLPPEPFINGIVIFDASISQPGWNGTTQPIDWYEWDFGDNSSKVKVDTPTTTHVYTVNNTYLVTLNVTDAQGHWNTTSKTLNVTVATIMHDIIVTNITLSATEAYPGGNPLYINVTVKNNGTTAENFTVTTYYNNTSIDTKNVTNLLALNWTTLTFAWNIPSIPKAYPYPIYIISTNASFVPGEANTTNNHLSDGTVTVRWPGDASSQEAPYVPDGYVNFFDLSLLATHWYGHDPATGKTYRPEVDFNMDGEINFFDLSILATNWYKGPLD